MAHMNIEFEARTSRRKYSLRRRKYTIWLFADGIDTGLHFHGLTKKEALEEGEILVDHAVEILKFHGLAEDVWYKLRTKRERELAGVAAGERVRLLDSFGGLDAGHEALVNRVDLNEDLTAVEDSFPVVVRVQDKEGKYVNVALGLTEFEVIK